MIVDGKTYMKCHRNTYETVRHSGWIKTAPITPGKIYEIIGECITWEQASYLIKKPDYKDAWIESWAKSSGKAPEYGYYKRLFEEPTEEEMLAYLRDKRLNDILG